MNCKRRNESNICNEYICKKYKSNNIYKSSDTLLLREQLFIDISK